MNYFFFLNHPDKNLQASIDIFNRPPSKTWSKQQLYDVNIHAFFSNGKKWIFYNIGKLKINEFKTIYKKDLPKSFHNQSVFISLNKNKYSELDELINENYMNSIPAWRSNIKLSNNNTSCSYQGEIPGSLIDKSLSLVSCSPMIQIDSNTSSFFYLINLNKDPKKLKFKFDIMNSDKKTLYSQFFHTNTINMINLNDISQNLTDHMYIFRSLERGGIPIFFTKNRNSSCLSLEHTHPPTEYTVHGNRFHFQKNKKNYWFKS